jgi:molybdopterin-guanine dinucleotide biosynthesis protein A
MTTPRSADILGCILAGGLSRRMGGGDKTLIEIAGRPMLARVVERLRPQVADLILNANGAAERFDSFDLPVVADTIEGFAGPLAGVLAGLHHSRTITGITHVASAAGDTPFLPMDLVARLAAEATTADTVVLATSGGNRHPVFGLWPVALADDLESWMRSTDTYKVLAWTSRHRLATVDFPMRRHGDTEIDPFFNANTPEDLATAERLAAEMTP